jgi:hypothetical protein
MRWNAAEIDQLLFSPLCIHEGATQFKYQQLLAALKEKSPGSLEEGNPPEELLSL